MIVNKFAGTCENCDERVEEGEGFVSLVGDDWVIRCNSCTMKPIAPKLERTGKCVICGLSKRNHLINVQGVCIDCE